MTVGTEYAFSNSSSQSALQLGALEHYLDPITTRELAELGIGAGARCLELGPGAGSIAAWLAKRAGPGGRVVAVDRDFSALPPLPDLERVSHDLHKGLPEELAGERFDVIHARLVLLHLPARRAMLRQLVAALAPGGWLMLGEFSDQPLRVFTATTEADAALFTRVVTALRDLLAKHNGVDFDWAHQAHGELVEAGLTEVATVEHAESWTGGEPGSQLHVANVSYLADRLRAAGITEAEQARFLELTADPRFSARSWQFVCTRGRKP